MNEITGGCQCGSVRYTLQAGDYAVYACHCLECQKQSASAFALSMPIRSQDIVIQGQVKAYQRPSDSGSVTSCYFCPNCGTRLYHQSVRSPEFMTLKGGTLDDSSSLNPVAHLWTKRKQAWLVLSSDVPAYKTQPDDLKKWRAALRQEK